MEMEDYLLTLKTTNMKLIQELITPINLTWLACLYNFFINKYN